MNTTAIRCACGAVTVEGEDFTNSMRIATFRREFPGVRLSSKRRYCNCDHCVNHWGIDLCGCGSGKTVGKCDGEFDECRNKQAAQVKGEHKPSAVECMIANGGWR
jgi:hypothetical protein